MKAIISIAKYIERLCRYSHNTGRKTIHCPAVYLGFLCIVFREKKYQESFQRTIGFYLKLFVQIDRKIFVFA